MIKAISTGLILLSVAACSAPSSPDASMSTVDRLAGQRVVVATRTAAPFTLMSPEKGMETVLPGEDEATEGADFRKKYGIDDPSMVIAQRLGESLDRETGADIRYEARVLPVENVTGIVMRVKGEDYVLDIATNGWGYHYAGFGSKQYFVRYSAQMRLIDSAAETAVLSELCLYDPVEAGKIPAPLERLTADNAARLKQDLADAAIYCADRFEARLLER